jgi:hypothetical protein
MASFIVPLFIIIILICYITFRARLKINSECEFIFERVLRFMTDKLEPIVLNKGGFIKNEIIYPDFERLDLSKFLGQCKENNIPHEIGKKFIIAVYNNIIWQTEPEAPKLSDDRYILWDLDEEIEEVLNSIFEEYNIEKIRWNNRDILDLVTFKDILLYIKEKIS